MILKDGYPVKGNAQSFFLNKKLCDQFQAKKKCLFHCGVTIENIIVRPTMKNKFLLLNVLLP